MVELFSKLVALIRDPTIVVVLISSSLTLFLIWKLFDKQYGFVKARLEMLLKENEDLRKHIDVFRQENGRRAQTDRLRKAEIVIDVQKKVAILLGLPIAETEGS